MIEKKDNLLKKRMNFALCFPGYTGKQILTNFFFIKE